MRKIIIAFVPVLHEGYRKFFDKHSDADTLYIFGKDLIEHEFTYLWKDTRALDQELMRTALESLGFFKHIEILTLDTLEKLRGEEIQIIAPDEDVSRELVEKYFKGKKIELDTVFLRLDKHKSMEEKPADVDQTITKDEFARTVIKDLKVEAEKSSDWYRRIASAIVRDGKILLVAHNEHLPNAHMPYVMGDPRTNFHKGVGVELSTSIHSEASLISEAARKGIALDGTSLYVTIFPCPPCAKLIANAGIKKLYYSGGYVVLDQDQLLKEKGVEIIYVDMN